MSHTLTLKLPKFCPQYEINYLVLNLYTNEFDILCLCFQYVASIDYIIKEAKLWFLCDVLTENSDSMLCRDTILAPCS